jgi:SH3 domain-containing YSC84-like protein 1
VQRREQERLKECAPVLDEILNVPEDIPKDLIDKAECFIVFPSVKKFAIGGSYGRGAITCRRGEHWLCGATSAGYPG